MLTQNMLDPESLSTTSTRSRRPRLVRADNKLRNKWLAAVTFLVIVLALLLWGSPTVQEPLVQIFSANAEENVFRLLIIFYSLFAILAILLITIAINLILVARKILLSNRFPAPGMRVLRDTWVVRGHRARLMSYLLLAVAAILIVSGTAISFYFHELLQGFLAQG